MRRWASLAPGISRPMYGKWGRFWACSWNRQIYFPLKNNSRQYLCERIRCFKYELDFLTQSRERSRGRPRHDEKDHARNNDFRFENVSPQEVPYAFRCSQGTFCTQRRVLDNILTFESWYISDRKCWRTHAEMIFWMDFCMREIIYDIYFEWERGF